MREISMSAYSSLSYLSKDKREGFVYMKLRERDNALKIPYDYFKREKNGETLWKWWTKSATFYFAEMKNEVVQFT